ncbi:tetratricopeptide repeat protein [Curtobacterium sp. 22159]|uniref:tetratricopeptide repeat protein n=1 Tax=Curtobacterium sp. 22159 TaxID=3453882 RepID=UPI003F832418
MATIRSAAPTDHDAILGVWRRAVEATHPFLSPADVDDLGKDVERYLPLMPDLRVAVDADRVLGFAAADGDTVEMLFVDPSVHRSGVGTALLDAVTAGHDVVHLDVNEQNPTARRYYAARGFLPVSRSATDGEGRAFPVLHLERRVLTEPSGGREDWERRVADLWADESIGDQERIGRTGLLAAAAPHPALGAFELGGSLDSAGYEVEADVHYAAATAAGLADVDPARAAQLVVQHASTLRNLGRTDEAVVMLREAPSHPSTGAAPRVFLALALHSAGRSAEALRVAIEAVEPTLPRYNRSVRAYAAALTED